VFQVATWKLLPGELSQNTVTITTLVGGVAPTPTPSPGSTGTPGGWMLFQAGESVQRIILPDPKICKTRSQLNEKQFQKDFTIC